MVVLENVSPPVEGVRHEQTDITAVLDGKGLGPGTLCVAETRVSWFDGSGLGFSLEYPSISLHAISRDLTAYPEEHLYVMVNSKFKEDSKDEGEKAKREGDDHSSDDEDGDDDSEDDSDDCDSNSADAVTEIRFVPNDKGSLVSMFTAMSECQALHPEPDDSDSDFDGDEYDVEEAEQGQIDLPTHYSFEEGMSQLTVEGQATADGLERMVPQPFALQYRMAGVKTEDPSDAINDEPKTNPGTRTVSGQFDDADVDH